MQQEEKLCNEVKTVRKFTYLDDMVNVVGRREVAVTD